MGTSKKASEPEPSAAPEEPSTASEEETPGKEAPKAETKEARKLRRKMVRKIVWGAALFAVSPLYRKRVAQKTLKKAASKKNRKKFVKKAAYIGASKKRRQEFVRETREKVEAVRGASETIYRSSKKLRRGLSSRKGSSSKGLGKEGS